jgi:hypothetical protein
MSQKTAETSVTCLSHSQSLQRPSQIKTVVPIPRMSCSKNLPISFPNPSLAWARDEPPSPTDPHDSLSVPSHDSFRRPSDAASYQSSDTGPSRWWTFTLPRPQRTNTLDKETLSEVKHDLRGNLLKDRPNRTLSGSGENATVGNPELKENSHNGWGLHLDIPRTPGKTFTLSHTQSPGWDTPWSARLPASVPRANGNGDAYNELGVAEHQPEEDYELNPWKQRKKVLRHFLLTNSYVPLVSSPVHAFHVSKSLTRLSLPVIPVCKYHLYHECTGHRDPNPRVRNEPSRQGCCGWFTVSTAPTYAPAADLQLLLECLLSYSPR